MHGRPPAPPGNFIIYGVGGRVKLLINLNQSLIVNGNLMQYHKEKKHFIYVHLLGTLARWGGGSFF